MDYRYKEGQKVKLRNDLVLGKGYRMLSGPMGGRRIYCVADTANMAGRIVTIDSANNAYRPKENYYAVFSDEMIVGLASQTPFVCRNLL